MFGLIASYENSTFPKEENPFVCPSLKNGPHNISDPTADSPNSSSFTGIEHARKLPHPKSLDPAETLDQSDLLILKIFFCCLQLLRLTKNK